jgi:hypothetical protein
MLKNITLTAEESMIKAAREKALKQHTTLNNEFRRWLSHYIQQENIAGDYQSLMNTLAYAYTTEKISRDEMNER